MLTYLQNIFITIIIGYYFVDQHLVYVKTYIYIIFL
jgi:hypothetical protein